MLMYLRSMDEMMMEILIEMSRKTKNLKKDFINLKQ